LALVVGVAVIVEKQTLNKEDGNLKDETLLVEVAVVIGLAAENMPTSKRI
jgi:hypothetical protein